MTAYVARNFTLKRGTGGGATLITQCTTLNVTGTHNGTDVTNKDSAGWQTFLEAGGNKSVRVEFEGIYDNSVAFEAFWADVQAGTITSYRMEYGDSDVIEGSFRPASWSLPSGTEGAQTITVSLESSGAVTFTNA